MSMSSKATPFSLEQFSFVKKLAEHLDLGPATDQRILIKHLPSHVPA